MPSPAPTKSPFAPKPGCPDLVEVSESQCPDTNTLLPCNSPLVRDVGQLCEGTGVCASDTLDNCPKTGARRRLSEDRVSVYRVVGLDCIMCSDDDDCKAEGTVECDVGASPARSLRFGFMGNSCCRGVVG